MRTTIRIDDDLYRAVKQRAAATGRSISEVLEDAVRAGLAPRLTQTPEALPPLPTFGGSGVVQGIDLTSNAALRDAMDDDQRLDALR